MARATGRRRESASCSRTTARSSPAPTIDEACYKAVTFERMCRFTYDLLAVGAHAVEDPAPSSAPS